MCADCLQQRSYWSTHVQNEASSDSTHRNRAPFKRRSQLWRDVKRHGAIEKALPSVVEINTGDHGLGTECSVETQCDNAIITNAINNLTVHRLSNIPGKQTCSSNTAVTHPFLIIPVGQDHWEKRSFRDDLYGSLFQQSGSVETKGSVFMPVTTQPLNTDGDAEQLGFLTRTPRTTVVRATASSTCEITSSSNSRRSKDLAYFHPPKALWHPHENVVALKEQGTLLTRGSVKAVLRACQNNILGKELEDEKSLAEQDVRRNSLLHLVCTRIHLLARTSIVRKGLYFLEILGWVMVCALITKKSVLVIKMEPTWVGGPNNLGNVLTLDKSSFLGDIKPGSTQSCLETNMYRAPVYPLKVTSPVSKGLETDQLLVFMYLEFPACQKGGLE
ncbi:transcription initiation factor TFIID subunit 1-like protein isoform X1, partial [Tanacetum coccineum]